jgi:hypothetical protein
VLIGSAAIALLTGKRVAGEERLQVITAGRLEGDAQEIVATMRAAGYEAAWKIEDPKIPMNTRLRRMTVHLIAGGRREAILDVYNSAAFDLVPYTVLAATLGGRAGRERGPRAGRERGPPATLKIGTPFVLMRYRLIDMWTIHVLMRLGIINEGAARSILGEMIAGYAAAAAYYEGTLEGAPRDPEGAALRLTPMMACIGRLEEPELALKRAAQSRAGGFFHPPYLPAGRGRKPEPATEKNAPGA